MEGELGEIVSLVMGLVGDCLYVNDQKVFWGHWVRVVLGEASSIMRVSRLPP